VSPLRIESASAAGAPPRRNKPLDRAWRRAPVPVVAGQQDLVALRIDALDPELAAGDRQRARQARRESARHVLDYVGREDVVEQLAPGWIRLRET